MHKKLIKNGELDYLNNYYHKELRKYKSLKKEEEIKLLREYKNTHNIEARDKVILCNLKYAYQLATKYMGRGIPFGSLVSEANTALLYAIEKYDFTQDVKLITYAKWWINRNIGREFESISARMEVPLSEATIDARLEEDDENIFDEYINDIERARLGEQDDLTFKNLNKLYKGLNEREVDVINMRFGIYPYDREHPSVEIAKKYKVSKERIRQIFDRAMTKMRTNALLDEDF